MFVPKRVWDRLIESHEAERNALLAANKAHQEQIESQKLTIRDLQGRIAFMQQAKKNPFKKDGTTNDRRKPYTKPEASEVLRREDNREELLTDNRDEDNYRHKMQEE